MAWTIFEPSGSGVGRPGRESGWGALERLHRDSKNCVQRLHAGDIHTRMHAMPMSIVGTCFLHCLRRRNISILAALEETSSTFIHRKTVKSDCTHWPRRCQRRVPSLTSVALQKSGEICNREPEDIFCFAGQLAQPNQGQILHIWRQFGDKCQLSTPLPSPFGQPRPDHRQYRTPLQRHRGQRMIIPCVELPERPRYGSGNIP